MRKAFVERNTLETKIKAELVLDGDGCLEGTSTIGFLDHMLNLLCKHGAFSLSLQVRGDTHIDFHHTVEDIGLCLGEAFLRALGNKAGINRYASLALPMDEALVLCAVDICGRPGLYFEVGFFSGKIGDFDTELVQVFWQAFASTAAITMHIRRLAGANSHHLAEAVFKGAGRVLREAARIEGDQLPTTKGVL